MNKKSKKLFFVKKLHWERASAKGTEHKKIVKTFFLERNNFLLLFSSALKLLYDNEDNVNGCGFRENDSEEYLMLKLKELNGKMILV